MCDYGFLAKDEFHIAEPAIPSAKSILLFPLLGRSALEMPRVPRVVRGRSYRPLSCALLKVQNPIAFSSVYLAHSAEFTRGTSEVSAREHQRSAFNAAFRMAGSLLSAAFRQ